MSWAAWGAVTRVGGARDSCRWGAEPTALQMAQGGGLRGQEVQGGPYQGGLTPSTSTLGTYPVPGPVPGLGV